MKDSENVANSSPSKAWWETRKGRIVVLAGVAGLFVLVFWLATKSRRMLVEQAALVVDERYLSFGEVWEDPAFSWMMPIRNTTNQAIEITGFSTSCLCSKIEPASLNIPAHGTMEVCLTLNLLDTRRGFNLAGREFKIAVQPRIALGAATQAGWIVQGRVKQPFSVQPPVVDFDDSLVRGESFAPRTATITCGLDVAELTARCDSPSFKFKVSRDEKNPRCFRLEIQPREDIPSGSFNRFVKLTASTPSQKEASGTVPVVGRVIEEISLQPDRIVFGAEVVGAELRETVILQSRKGKEFTIQEIEKGKDAGIAVDLGLKKKDGVQNLVVSFPVKRLGHQEYTIHVKVKTPDGSLDLPLRMSCYGIPGKIAGVAKQSKDLGENVGSR